jgi:hypothetical protein
VLALKSPSEANFQVARDPETTVSGQASGLLLQYGDNPSMGLFPLSHKKLLTKTTTLYMELRLNMIFKIFS